MALSSVAITGNLSDMLGTDFDTRRTKIWVTTNVVDDTVIDTVGNKIRLGSGNVTLAADGTFTANVWVPGTGSNPDSWQTYIHVDYPDRNAPRGRATRTFGPFTITAAADLADLVEEQEVPAEYLTTVTTLFDGYVTEAEAARDETQALRDGIVGDLGTTDSQTATLINSPGSLTETALSASVASEGNAVQKWLRADGVRRSARSAGDGLTGLVDLALGMTSGYGLHLTMSSPSAATSLRAALGIGTDLGGTGIYIHQKATEGNALSIDQSPGAAGVGLTMDARTTQSAAAQFVIHPGNFGVFVSGSNDKGYAGGQITAGSTALYVPSGDFTAGDIGKVIRQAAYTGTATDQDGTIPSGTTITAVTDATHVTLSNAAAYTGTALQLMLVGRAPASTQPLFTVFDESAVAVMRVRRAKVETFRPVDLGATLDSETPLTVTARPTPSASMFKVLKSGDASASLEVQSTGRTISRYSALINNAGILTNPALVISNLATTSVAALRLVAPTTPTAGANQIEMLESTQTFIQSRFDSAGTFMTRVNSAPADASIATNEVSWWFDSTAGAAKVKFKGKDAGGTVRTGEVALA